MAKWKYCKIIAPITADIRIGTASVVFLGTMLEYTKTEAVAGKELEYKLAQLGEEGWELVSHTVVWGRESGNKTIPLEEIYYLKQQVE
jgi:hypothetical protein